MIKERHKTRRGKDQKQAGGGLARTGLSPISCMTTASFVYRKRKGYAESCEERREGPWGACHLGKLALGFLRRQTFANSDPKTHISSQLFIRNLNYGINALISPPTHDPPHYPTPIPSQGLSIEMIPSTIGHTHHIPRHITLATSRRIAPRSINPKNLL
jgi:hypothetical protein